MKNEIKILIIEDEKKIVEIERAYLEKNNYIVYTAFDGHTGLKLFEKIKPSLIILDLMLPDMSGEEICKILRRKTNIPILMLTAKIQDENIVNGLNIGADDYMTKPFSPKQLVARVDALIRRMGDSLIPINNILEYNNGDLIIDFDKYEVIRGGKVVNLTPNEYKILVTMTKRPKKVFTRDELLLIAIEDNYDVLDRVIDTHIKNLRQKIEEDTKNPKYILTVYGVGYKFGGEQQ